MKFEITNFRQESGYSDSRHPDKVEIIKTFEGDAARRDFTVNALGIDRKGILHDYVNGIEDLNQRILRAVGEPAIRFQEDALRILRAIRFAIRFGFKIESKTEQAIIHLKDTIKKVAPERIKDEIWKVASISGSALADYIEYLDKVGLLEIILPEIKQLQTAFHEIEHHPEGAWVEPLV